MTLKHPVISHFKALLAIDNPSRHEAAMRTHVLSTLQQLDRTGLIKHTHVDDIGNLLVTLSGQGKSPPLMLCAHMDSVPPCINIGYDETIDDAGEPILKAAGRTILGADDRAGIATMLAIVEQLSATEQAPSGDVELYFSVQEEIGINGARALDLAHVQSQHIYVLDGEGHAGDIFNAGPARQAVEITLKGIAGHAGLPEEGGLNAIYLAIQLLKHLPPSGRLSPDTSFNIGRIKGGLTLNAIPEHTLIEAELRSFDMAELARINTQLQQACQAIETAFPGAKIHCNIRHQYDPFVIPESAHSIQQALQSALQANLTPSIKRMYIGSDAHILNARGREAIVLGMGFHGSHSVRELIRLKELIGVVEWVWALIH